MKKQPATPAAPTPVEPHTIQKRLDQAEARRDRLAAPTPQEPFYGNSTCGKCKKPLHGKKTFAVPVTGYADMIVCEECAAQPVVPPMQEPGKHKFVLNQCVYCGSGPQREYIGTSCVYSPVVPPIDATPEQMKDREIGQSLWPFPDHELGHRMRYAPQHLTREDFMRAARELDAYARLISLPQKRRNEICSQISKGPNA